MIDFYSQYASFIFFGNCVKIILYYFSFKVVLLVIRSVFSLFIFYVFFCIGFSLGYCAPYFWSYSHLFNVDIELAICLVYSAHRRLYSIYFYRRKIVPFTLFDKFALCFGFIAASNLFKLFFVLQWQPDFNPSVLF